MEFSTVTVKRTRGGWKKDVVNQNLEFSTVSASVTNRRLVKNKPNSTLEVTLLGPVFVVRLITRLESSGLKYQEVKLTRALINRPSCQPSADRSEPAWSSGKAFGW